MKLRALFPIAALGLALAAFSQQPQIPQPATDPALTKILTEISDRSELMPNLEYLTDVIGPRITGSENLKRANEWTAQKFREYGLENVHLESYPIAHSWKRGRAVAGLVKPTEGPLTVASMGWSPGTGGLVQGQVVPVEATRKEELERYRGTLKGAIVPVGRPTPRPAPGAVFPPLGPLPFAGPPGPDQFARLQQFRRELEEFLKSEGALAVLRDSGKEHGLLNMGSSGRNFQPGTLPTAMVTGEDYSRLWRLLDRHEPVEVQLDLENSFSPGPVEVANTVAEIRGSEKPDEVVILGAHLDSWDLGTGATDNGTGSMAVLEAARSLKASGLKPRRTIRFILFSGEEQGLVGSREYVKAHQAEMDKISGVLVHDTGTGRVKSIGLMGRYEVRQAMDQILAPLRDLKIEELSMRRMSGTDHLSFDQAGVPAFAVLQDPGEYAKTHHSQSDTFDKVNKDDLVQGAEVLAGWAYRVAQWEEMLPRKKAAATQVAADQ